jgi:hypothetical protein
MLLEEPSHTALGELVAGVCTAGPDQVRLAMDAELPHAAATWVSTVLGHGVGGCG